MSKGEKTTDKGEDYQTETNSKGRQIIQRRSSTEMKMRKKIESKIRISLLKIIVQLYIAFDVT